MFVSAYKLYNIGTHIKLQSKEKYKVSEDGTDLSLFFIIIARRF